ncbi:MAG TPA: hypothetical protein VLX29_08950 [Nitrospirota bacterium]|nr:hypothetical protein [Nitrospirota bacterium]HUL00969.1 hypothetical protein [Nitrospirota bacterium]
MTNPGFKFCTIVHLAVFFAAIAWHMQAGSIACVFDQLTETFEFMFSPLPLENSYMLSNPAAEAIALQLIAIFFITGIPSYAIGYPLFLRYFSKPL